MNKKKTVIIIGQLPPIITGQSLVTADVYDILYKNGAKIKAYNLVYTEYRYFKKFIVLFKIFFGLSLDIILSNSVIYISAARTRSGFLRNAYFIILSSLFKRKILVHFHCGEYNDFLDQNGVLFLRFAKFIFEKVDVSIILGNSLLKNYSSIFNNKMQVFVIPNGIKIQKKTEYIKYNSDVNILFMSNLIESKGYLDLLEAISILVNKNKIENIKLDLCGKFLDHEDNVSYSNIEEYSNYFKDFISKNRLTNYVNYHDLVTGNIKERLLQECDIFVLPTYYSTEAQPLSILEALSYGKIVITTDHRGIPDMVIDGYNGLIVDKKSPLSISEAILNLLKNRSLHKELSLNAKIHVERNFSYEKFEKNIVNLFKKYQVV